MAQEIKFGTDGWRGIIADDFTFDNVRRVANAIASYVLKHEDPKRGVFIGYDTRFVSQNAARVAAEAIAAAPRDPAAPRIRGDGSDGAEHRRGYHEDEGHKVPPL